MSARITVVKTSFHMDLIARHFPEAARTATPCPEFREGQVFEIQASNIVCPEGFCDYAWSTIERMVGRACKGEQLMWANAFPCCADGLRPVTFHIESIDDERRESGRSKANERVADANGENGSGRARS